MIDFNMEKMGQRIKELRTDLGISQKELASRVGVAQNTIAQYEKGTANTSLDILFKLARVFNITADYLLGLID